MQITQPDFSNTLIVSGLGARLSLAGGYGERDAPEGIVKKGNARGPCGGSGERMEPDKGQNLF